VANNTGGTAAPSIRVPAAAQALGAPKVSSIRAQAPSKGVTRAKLPAAPKGASRYLNKASGKMETAKAMKAYVAPGPAQPKAPSQSRSLPGAAPKAEKGFLEMNPAQLHHFVEKQVQSNTKAELTPYKARGQEITGTENTVAKRYGAYGEATQSLLGGIQSGAEAGAKTADNLAAQVAVKGQGEVNTAGQNATTLNGGQLEPSVKAGTEAGAANIAGLGAAAQANSVAQGQNEANLLTNIRAAAAQRVAEGQKGIATNYGKERGKNQAEEGRLLAKQSGDISKLDTELAQKQEADKIARAGVGIKEGTLKVGEQNAASKARSVTAAEKNNAAKNALTAKGQGITRANDEAKNQIAGVKLQAEVKHDAASDEEARAKAKKELQTAAKGGLTTSEQDKYAEQIGSAFNTIQNLREKGVPENKIGTTLSNGYERRQITENGKEKAVNFKYTPVKNATLQKAAFELWKYHTVSAPTQKALGTLGISLTPQQLAALVGL
jgi:hypothetical protein